MGTGWPARDTRLAFVGRFLPPTTADELVLAFAAAATGARVTIVVLHHPADAIALDRRLRWLRDMAPAARIESAATLTPAASDVDGATPATIAHDDVLRLRALADAVVGHGLEDRQLARAVNLPYVPVDVAQPVLPIASDGKVPSGRWDDLPGVVRADLARRVVIMGPESTGKSTLAGDLARHYGTVWVGEYLRLWLDAKEGVCEPHDLPPVVAGQRASEDALARRANRVLFSDTDPLMTAVYSRFYYRTLPGWLDEAASARRADAYLLLDCDVPWVADPQRDMPHRRHEIRDLCQEELERRGLPWHLVRGSWDERFATACGIVDELLR